MRTARTMVRPEGVGYSVFRHAPSQNSHREPGTRNARARPSTCGDRGRQGAVLPAPPCVHYRTAYMHTGQTTTPNGGAGEGGGKAATLGCAAGPRGGGMGWLPWGGRRPWGGTGCAEGRKAAAGREGGETEGTGNRTQRHRRTGGWGRAIAGRQSRRGVNKEKRQTFGRGRRWAGGYPVRATQASPQPPPTARPAQRRSPPHAPPYWLRGGWRRPPPPPSTRTQLARCAHDRRKLPRARARPNEATTVARRVGVRAHRHRTTSPPRPSSFHPPPETPTPTPTPSRHNPSPPPPQPQASHHDSRCSLDDRDGAAAGAPSAASGEKGW